MADKFTERVKWMVSKIMESYALDAETVQKCFLENMKKIDGFLADPTTPPKLFVYYQPRQFKKLELFISLNDDKLSSKCAYFVRLNQGKKTVKQTVAHDSQVLFGEVSKDILHGFQQVLQNLYNPMLQAQPEWGLIKSDKKQQPFLGVIGTFQEDLKHTIANLRGDVELRVPEAPHDKIEQKPAAYARAAKDPVVLKHFQDIVTSWCDQITKYMNNDKSKEPIDAKQNSGPEVEIEYWSRRMLTLISITEQLKTKPSRVVTGVLKARALRSEPDDAAAAATEGGALSEQDQIKNLIERWREVDLCITDYLNEAKDNVRFLENLRLVIVPLYTEHPKVIADVMDTLMNSMKMIHTLSRHYGTEVRMTNLFERITNQLILRCRDEIYSGKNVQQLWQQDPSVVMDKMQASIALCETYMSQYNDTKDKLARMPKGKQFNFDEGAIFEKLTKFRRRLEKLIDMFSSIKQFKSLQEKQIDGIEALVASFDQLVGEFRGKGHDLLALDNAGFERDFVEFAMRNSGLESACQDFMERSLAKLSSIVKQLELMQKFKEVLHREALKDDLQLKYVMIFKLYGEDLFSVQSVYEKNKEDPPIPRNMTRIAGNILWSRQLLRHITKPMKWFKENPKVFRAKESKNIVKRYNKLARTLLEFEGLYFDAFLQSTQQAKQGLRSHILARNPTTSELFVNFDDGILQLTREAKHLQMMQFSIPNNAKIVLLLQNKLKRFFVEFQYVLTRYKEVTKAVNPVCRHLLKPHFKDLASLIEPAISTMTWTSMNIDIFLKDVTKALTRFEYLVNNLNDIIENRVHNNLAFVSTLLLLHLPAGTSFTIKNFLTGQKKHITRCTEILAAKNIEIDRAVDDLVDMVLAYPLTEEAGKPEQMDINFVKLHYSHLTYHALLNSTKQSLNELKSRISSRSHGPLLMSASLFEIELSLTVPNVTLTPSLSEIQEAINTVARDVLQCTRQLMDWGIDGTARARPPKPF
jgi:dynein heavy chain